MSSVENFYSEDQYVGSRNRISQGAVLNCVNKSRENLLVGDPVRLGQCHPSGGHMRPDLHPLFTLKSQQTIKKEAIGNSEQQRDWERDLYQRRVVFLNKPSEETRNWNLYTDKKQNADCE